MRGELRHDQDIDGYEPSGRDEPSGDDDWVFSGWHHLPSIPVAIDPRTLPARPDAYFPEGW